MKPRFTPRALQDLTAIAEYIVMRNPVAALRVRAAILDSVQNLAAFPHIGRPQAVEGVRKLVTRKYSYLVYYSLDEEADEIVIISIQHAAREREYENV
jgi:plasmid stabilization system protein ParE